MDDNDNEGRIGWSIEQIANLVPDVSEAGIEADAILLHAGTNDANTYGWEEAHVRLGELIDVVTAEWPEAAVLVAKIVPATGETGKNVEAFNEEVQGMLSRLPGSLVIHKLTKTNTGVVDERADAGKTVTVVDMFAALDVGTDLSDDLHPNDQGYEKMADVWFDGLAAVNELGWL